MLIEKIRADFEAARGETRVLLKTLYAEAAMVGKSNGNRASTDDEVIEVVRNFVTGIRSCLAKVDSDPNRAEYRAKLEREQNLIAAYLPPQLNADELRRAVQEIVDTLPERSMKQMRAVMDALKTRHGKNFDGELASVIAKELLR